MANNYRDCCSSRLHISNPAITIKMINSLKLHRDNHQKPMVGWSVDWNINLQNKYVGKLILGARLNLRKQNLESTYIFESWIWRHPILAIRSDQLFNSFPQKYFIRKCRGQKPDRSPIVTLLHPSWSHAN